MLRLLVQWLLLAVFFGLGLKLLEDRGGVAPRTRFALFIVIALGMAFAGLLLHKVAQALRGAW
jgi:hypothetical protein